jgi:hypothetical protein
MEKALSTKKYTTTNKITPQNHTKENVIVWFEFLSRGKINLSLSSSKIYGERKNGMRKQWLQKGKRTVAVVLAAALVLSGVSVNTSKNEKTVKATEKTEKSTTSELAGASSFEMANVTVTDTYYSNSLTQEVVYLKKLDENKLLAGFKETAGYASGMNATQVKEYMGTTRYTGGGNWEDSLIGGHTLGHYLTALAQAVSNPGISEDDKSVLEGKLSTIINTLKECQEKTKGSSKCNEGYIFGATLLSTTNLELQFDNVEANKTNIGTQAWVPWYTMHKILAGLVSVYELTGNNDALTIAQGLGEWTYNRVSKWSDSTRTKVLNIEYGGMNDALYELAACTSDTTMQEHFLTAAAQFDETTLFEKVKKGDTNCLNDLHANTTIPKFLGALNRYVVLNKLNKATEADDVYLEYVEKFWDMVVNKHTYITGGCSEWEHFGKDYVLDGERTNCNNETCAAYNMLKISRMLFMITGEKKYSDYYESTLINAIMAAQNPETGMSMYFQPMKSGYFKVYSTEDKDFWCCTGSGMEDFTKLNDSIYFYKDSSVIVNQYRSSVLTWSEKNLKLTQTADLLTGTEQKFTVNKINDADITADSILFRIPDYAAGDVTIKVNDNVYNYTDVNGYAKVSGTFSDGDVITVTIPEEVTYENLTNGDPSTVSTDVYGFKYGPFVLAADLGNEKTSAADISTTGVTVDIPTVSTLKSENIKVSAKAENPETWLKNVNGYMEKTVKNGTVSFTMKETDSEYTFVPYYQIYQNRYGIYWSFSTDESALALKAKEDAREEKELDKLQPGYGQNENDSLHSLADNGSESQTASGSSRWATAGGSFSYRMLVSDTTDTTLICQFAKADNGKSIKITVGDNVIAAEKLNYKGDSDIYEKYYTISKEITSANLDTSYAEGKAVKITFASNDNGVSAALYNEVYTYEKIGTTAELKNITSKSGTVSRSEDSIKISVAKDTSSVDVTFELQDTNGYVSFDGEVFDDSEAKTFDLGSTRKIKGTLRVYAEDFITYKDYELTIVKDYEKDDSLEYFVDCGDYNVTTVSDGDKLGKRNSVTEQVYGEDPVTGYKWGVVDTVSDPLKNGTSPATEDAAYTDQTWPFETDATITDGVAKTRTNRYTKNQFENGVTVRFLDYAFELDNGEYNVEVGFCNPWSCSTNPNLYANYGEENEITLGTKIGVPNNGTKTVTGTVTVTNGKLTLNARSDANDSTTLAINMTYIKISKVEKSGTDANNKGKDDTAVNSNNNGNNNTNTTTDTTKKTTTTKTTTTAKKKTMKLSSVKAKKGTKKITGKVSVKKATVKIKVGKKKYKKAKVSGKKFTLKTSKLKKGTKITIKVTKSGYKTLTKTYKVK